jgi:hypothetical protein
MNMKKVNFFLVTLAILAGSKVISSQDCVFYYPDVEGAKIELTHYDDKGKITGKSKQEVVKVERAGSNVKALIKSEYYDDKNELVFESEMEFRCEGGIFYVDMDNYLGEQSLAAFKDAEMEIKGDNLEYPSGMKVGDVLGDGTVTLSFSSGGMSMMNMTTTVKNRKVEAIEDITTSAGTFKCFKISYDVESKTFIKTITAKAVQWFSEDVGMVKTESYDQKGRLTGSTVLTAIQK